MSEYEVADREDSRNAGAYGGNIVAERVRKFGSKHRRGHRVTDDCDSDRRYRTDFLGDRDGIDDDDIRMDMHVRVHAESHDPNT